MEGALTSYMLFAIILFTYVLPTRVDCCSGKVSDIIDLIARDPEYRSDPCYIKWKTEHPLEQKLRVEELETNIDHKNLSHKQLDGKKSNHRRTQQYTRINNPNTKLEKSTRLSNAAFIAMVVGIIVSVSAGIGCCGACIYFTKRKKWTTETAFDNNDGFTVLSTTPGLASHAWGNQSRNVSSTANASAAPTAPEIEYESFTSQDSNRIFRGSIRQQPETNVTLLRRGVDRQNSLPSYDDVLKMPISYSILNK